MQTVYNMRKLLAILASLLLSITASQSGEKGNKSIGKNLSSAVVSVQTQAGIEHTQVRGAHIVHITASLDFRGETNIERNFIMPFPDSFFVHTTNNTGVQLGPDPADRWMYFMATNSFCGLIELTDQAGQKLPLLKPQVDSEAAYPASFQIWQTRLSHHVRRSWECPVPLVPQAGTNVEMRPFKLEDYFKIQIPGEYHLTVRPKIYKRSATNNDLCERIDLSPVTVPVHWVQK
jgi:hypothetical protein